MVERCMPLSKFMDVLLHLIWMAGVALPSHALTSSLPHSLSQYCVHTLLHALKYHCMTSLFATVHLC